MLFVKYFFTHSQALKNIIKNLFLYHFYYIFKSEIQMYQYMAIRNYFDFFKLSKILIPNDYQITFKEISTNGMNLQYASNEMQNNKIIVLLAFDKNKESFQFASKNLKNDPIFIENALLENIYLKPKRREMFKYISKDLKNNKNFIKKIVINDPYAIKFTPFKKDKEIAILAIYSNYMILTSLDKKLQNDRNFLLECIENKKDMMVLLFATKDILLDDNFINKSIIASGLDKIPTQLEQRIINLKNHKDSFF